MRAVRLPVVFDDVAIRISLKGWQKVAGGLRCAAITGYYLSNPPG
jgi:hypothetical protein